MTKLTDQDFAAQIASAFAPGMADSVLIHEAVERTRLQAEMLGLDGVAIVDRAKFRYVESPRSGTSAFIEMLEDVLREEMVAAPPFNEGPRPPEVSDE